MKLEPHTRKWLDKFAADNVLMADTAVQMRVLALLELIKFYEKAQENKKNLRKTKVKESMNQIDMKGIL